MNEEIILALKQRAKEMLEGNYKRKIGDEELYTIICEWENCYKENEMNHKTACENAKSVLDIEKPYKEQMELLEYMSKRFEEAIVDIHLSNMFWAVMRKDNIDIKTLMEREMSGYYDSKIVEEENQS